MLIRTSLASFSISFLDTFDKSMSISSSFGFVIKIVVLFVAFILGANSLYYLYIIIIRYNYIYYLINCKGKNEWVSEWMSDW